MRYFEGTHCLLLCHTSPSAPGAVCPDPYCKQPKGAARGTAAGPMILAIGKGTINCSTSFLDFLTRLAGGCTSSPAFRRLLGPVPSLDSDLSGGCPNATTTTDQSMGRRNWYLGLLGSEQRKVKTKNTLEGGKTSGRSRERVVGNRCLLYVNEQWFCFRIF